MNDTENEIVHDEIQEIFTINTEDRESYLKYSVQGETVTLFSTFVHPKDRGRGVAEKLVLRALSFAKRNGYRINPTCSYVSAFLKRKPNWDNIV